MMDLSLHGSHISLSKTSLSSSRISSRTFDKLKHLKFDSSNKEDSAINLSERNVNSKQKNIIQSKSKENNKEFDIHLDLHELDTDSDLIQPITFLPSAEKRSQKTVSDWLNANVNQQSSQWTKPDSNEDHDSLISSPNIVSQFTHDQQDSNLSPELNCMIDSLELNSEKKKENKRLNLDKLPDENEHVQTPPPCATRPFSNSLTTGRNVNNSIDEDVNLLIQKRRNSAALIIQTFWRHHKRRILAAEAAVHRMMEEQKQRLIQINLNRGNPLSSVMEKKETLIRQRRKKQRQQILKAFHENDKREKEKKISDNLSELKASSNDNPFNLKRCISKTEIDDVTNQISKPIIDKPTSPIKTNAYKLFGKEMNDQTIIFKDKEENKQEESVSKLVSSNNQETSMNSLTQLNDQKIITFDTNKEHTGNVTVKNILEELNELQQSDNVTDYPVRDQIPLRNRDVNYCTQVKDDLHKQKSFPTVPNTWSEMVDDINRVLSEAEHDQLNLGDFSSQYKFIRARSSTSLRNQNKSPSLFQPSTARTIMSTYSMGNSSGISALTKENLKYHTKMTERNERIKQAQEEINQSIKQSRAQMANYVNQARKQNTGFGNPTNLLKNSSRSQGLTKQDITPKRVISAHKLKSNTNNLNNDLTSDFGEKHIISNRSDEELLKSDDIHRSYNKFSHTNSDPHFYDNNPNLSKNIIDVNVDRETLLMELDERNQSIQRMRRTLEHQRELSVRQLRDTQREAEQRIESMKADYESTLNRNYKLIDELIEEKKSLHNKYENMLAEVKSITNKSEEKIKILEDRHKIELRKLEAKCLAAEKLRREKWEAEKTKQLKELTVRGMQSELAQMIANHKAEMRQLRQSSAEQIEEADTRAYQVYTHQIEELRQNLMREKEEACTKEREMAEQRLNQTLKEERLSLEAQRRRMLDEVSDERERLALTATKQREEAEKVRQASESAISKMMEEHKHDLNQLKEELINKHKEEIFQIQERNATERSAWEEHIKSVLESQYITKESNLRDQLKKERDRLLEAAVQRLEGEANNAREEADREVELKIKRVKEKLGAEIEELERSEKQAMEKYGQMKAQYLDKEHEADRLRSQLTQKEEELNEVRILYEKLNRERQNISDVIRQEFADRLVMVEEENRTTKRELAECKARLNAEQERHENELQGLRKSNTIEIETVHQKVKELIAKKEEQFATLKKNFQRELEEKDQEIENANKQSAHLEELLDQQRKQFLQKAH